MQLVPRVRKAQGVTLALKAKKGQEVIPVFKAILALRVRQEPKEFKVTLAFVVKKAILVLVAKQDILDYKAQQGKKVDWAIPVLLEKMVKTV